MRSLRSNSQAVGSGAKAQEDLPAPARDHEDSDDAQEGDKEQNLPCEDCDQAFFSDEMLRQQHQGSGTCTAKRQEHAMGTAVLETAHLHDQDSFLEEKHTPHDVAVPKKSEAAQPRKYACETCAASFSQSNHLRRHERTHTGEKPYACETCGASFAQSSALRVHQRRHTGEKPCACETCGASFAQSSALRVHQRRHTGEKPYACETCGALFAESGHL